MTISLVSAPAAFNAGIKSCSAKQSKLQIIDSYVHVCVCVYVQEGACINCCVFISVLRYTEEEIRQKVSTFRQMLMDKEGVITREGSHTQPV